MVVIEAGRLPGIICLFSVYNQRHERSWRVTIVFGGAALAGAFGRIFAYAVGLMDGIGGRKRWKWYSHRGDFADRLPPRANMVI